MQTSSSQSQKGMEISYDQFKAMQPQLRKLVHSIITSYPHPGIYKNEISKGQWDLFIEEYKRVLSKQEGERGIVAKQVAQDLLPHGNEIRQLFDILGIKISQTSHIKSIATLFQDFAPCKLYTQWMKTKDAAITALKSLQFISSNQDKRQEIMTGLLTKRTLIEAEQTYQQIIESQKKKTDDLSVKEQQLFFELQQCPKYQAYAQVKQLLQPSIYKWEEVDQRVGKESVQRGSSFETMCETFAIDLILEEQGKTRAEVTIERNIDWHQIPGEIDFVLLDSNGVIAFMECKSRLFDIAEGHRQSGEEGRTMINKTHIKINSIPLQVSLQTPCYVLTVIPPHIYYLGFESDIKTALNNFTKNLTAEEIAQVNFDELFVTLCDKFKDSLSPSTWLSSIGNQYLIVLPSLTSPYQI